MSLNRYARRRDENERDLFEIAEQLGAKIHIAGPLDAWVGWRGQWYPVEVKTTERKPRYTPQQTLFFDRSLTHNLPIWIWRTPDDVLKCLGVKS